MSKERTAGEGSPEDGQDALLTLLHHMETLKHLPRAGWVDREIALPESVAAHSWRVAMLAWLIARGEGLDAAKAVEIALVHDLPEAIAGDRTPFDGHGATAAARRALAAHPPDQAEWRSAAQREEKHAAERQALESMLVGLPAAPAVLLRGAWEEYEAGTSPEARLVKQLDKLEAYLQGLEYAQSGRLPDPETLNSFRIDTSRAVHHPMLRALIDAAERWSASVTGHGAPGDAYAGRDAGA